MPALKLSNMPKAKTVDGVSYNVDHAKKIGKDAFAASPEFATHFPDMPDDQRKKILGDVFDKITAPPPASTASPSPSKP